MLAADTVLQGRYRIVRQLGQGGMGAVYEAVDERLDTIVALKETLFADEKLRKQFEREANATPTAERPAQPSDSNQPANGLPAESIQADPAKTNESKIEKKADTAQRAATSKQSATKTETSKPTNEQSGLPPSTAHNAGRNPDRKVNPNPAPSQSPQGRQPGHPPGSGGGPAVRTLPNGTRIVTQPDGTRVVTMPNGDVRVIPPGEKRARRRNRP